MYASLNFSKVYMSIYKYLEKTMTVVYVILSHFIVTCMNSSNFIVFVC